MTLFAVMDGHAGISCSNFVTLNLERNILDSLRDQRKRDANAEQILKSSLLAGFKVTEHSFHQPPCEVLSKFRFIKKFFLI